MRGITADARGAIWPGDSGRQPARGRGRRGEGRAGDAAGAPEQQHGYQQADSGDWGVSKGNKLVDGAGCEGGGGRGGRIVSDRRRRIGERRGERRGRRRAIGAAQKEACGGALGHELLDNTVNHAAQRAKQPQFQRDEQREEPWRPSRNGAPHKHPSDHRSQTVAPAERPIGQVLCAYLHKPECTTTRRRLQAA